jgi:hypothetical protein
MIRIAEKHGFLTALVVAVRFKTDYELINSYFSDYAG